MDATTYTNWCSIGANIQPSTEPDYDFVYKLHASDCWIVGAPAQTVGNFIVEFPCNTGCK